MGVGVTIAARCELHDDEALAVLATVRLYEQAALVDAVTSAQQDGDAEELVDIVSQLFPPQLDPAQSNGDPGLDPDRTTVRATLKLLAEPAVAAAVLAEMGVDEERGAVALGLFAESVEPLAPRAARPALRWLRARRTRGSVTSSKLSRPTAPRSLWTRRGR